MERANGKGDDAEACPGFPIVVSSRPSQSPFSASDGADSRYGDVLLIVRLPVN
jgi:hypothetical protein